MKQSIPSLLSTGAAALLVGAVSQAQISFDAAVNIATGQQPDTVAVGDFDGDGDRDLAVTVDAPDRVQIFINNGSGSFAAGQSVQLGTNIGAAGLVAANFDGDIDIDLALTQHNQNSVRLLINAGNATFSLGSTATVGTDPREIAAGDLDADGDNDLVTSNRDSSTLSVVLNNGGTLGGVSTFASGAEPREVALGLFNDDGLPDIAVAAHDDRNVNVFMNQGGGSFSGPTSLSVGPNLRPEGVTTADLDGDCDIDIAAATDDNGPSLATVFLNLGSGSFSGPASYSMGGQEPGSIVAADFDADGDQDLATANQSTGNVSTIRNNGDGTFAGPQTFAVGTTPEHLEAADFDGNNSPDIVAVNRDSNNLSVLLNQENAGTQNYCATAPNSEGSGAVMGSEGSLNIVDNTFTVTAMGAIPGQPGIFFYGANQTQVPFGEGFRCVQNPVFRLNPPQPADGEGCASRLVNFTQPPAGSGLGMITAGSTWNFQFWYRDPAGGGSNFNLSDGLSATFLP